MKSSTKARGLRNKHIGERLEHTAVSQTTGVPKISPTERLLHTILGEQPSGFQVAEIVERGLPTTSVDVLRKEGLTFGEVHGLVVPARTLKHRTAKKQALSIDETDRALRVAKVLALAEQVFDDHDKALGWLRRGNKRLNDRTPLDMLRSEVGGDLVRQMLYQIDEGIYV
ncbi:MAG: antitoxin Xre/MbcA/ParS toxin-binding domain-containing protein [Acidobacteriaceae bacterium]